VGQAEPSNGAAEPTRAATTAHLKKAEATINQGDGKTKTTVQYNDRGDKNRIEGTMALATAVAA